MTDRDDAESSRRDFIKRVSLGAAFATPIITSFSMSGMSAAASSMGGDSSDGSNASNVTIPN